MHQLWRRDNGVWYVLYGPRLRRQISTQTQDRREAERFLARFIASSDEPEQPTVGEVLAAYADDRCAGIRAPESLRYAVKGLTALQDLYPMHLTPAVITQWAQSRGASNGTVLREIGVLRAALAWARRHRRIADAPAICNPVPTPPPRQRWLSRDEGRALIAACRAPHVRLFIVLGLMTLARTGAILDAKWSQIDWDRGIIDYGQGHGNKRRAIVPLNDDAIGALRAAKTMASSAFIIEYRGMRVRAIKNGFSAARRRAGLGPEVTPHVLRHSGASWLVEAGVPDEEVARMLGDTADMVRRVYGHFSPTYLRRAAAALQLGDST